MQLPQVKEERDLLLKKIYDYCVKANWQKTKLDEMARELGTTRTNLRKQAKKYAKKILTAENYQKLIEHVDEIIDFERKDTKTKLTVINPILLTITGKSTYLLWETEEEKKLVLKTIYDYCINENWDKLKLEELAKNLGFSYTKIKELAKKYVKEYFPPKEYVLLIHEINDNSISNRELNKITLSVVNPILLQKLGKSTFLLWESEEEKELVLKYIYLFCDKFNFSNEKIEQLSNYLGISSYKINEFYKEYVFKYLKWTKEEYHKKRCKYAQNNRLKKEPESKKIYDSLLIVSSIEDILKIINNSKLKIQTIKRGISNYTNTYHNGNQNIKKDLSEKINRYIDYESKQKLSTNKNVTEQITIASTIIKAFVDSQKYLTVEDFCKKEGIDKEIFNEYLSIILDYNLELFNQYSFKITNNNVLINKIKQIIMYINFGINENGIVRSFDIIDYYLTVKIPLNNILELTKSILSNDEYLLLRAFVFDNKALIKEDYSEEFKITDKKNEIIFFLNNNDIPVNSMTYNIAYRRYINGTLDLNLLKRLK